MEEEEEEERRELENERVQKKIREKSVSKSETARVPPTSLTMATQPLSPA